MEDTRTPFLKKSLRSPKGNSLEAVAERILYYSAVESRPDLYLPDDAGPAAISSLRRFAQRRIRSLKVRRPPFAWWKMSKLERRQRQQRRAAIRAAKLEGRVLLKASMSDLFQADMAGKFPTVAPVSKSMDRCLACEQTEPLPIRECTQCGAEMFELTD